MTNQQNMTPEEEKLWKRAEERVGFKRHLTTYLIINCMIWLIWYFTGGHYSGFTGIPWAVFPTIGWGIGITFHYFNTFVFDEGSAVEREYEKLKRK
jgi:hypothetical protein